MENRKQETGNRCEPQREAKGCACASRSLHRIAAPVHAHASTVSMRVEMPPQHMRMVACAGLVVLAALAAPPVSRDQTKSNHQDTKADERRAAPTGSIATLIADEVGDPLPEVMPSRFSWCSLCLGGSSPVIFDGLLAEPQQVVQ